MQMSRMSEGFIAACLAHPWAPLPKDARAPKENNKVTDKKTAREICSILVENKVLLRTLDYLNDSRCDQTKKSVLNRLIENYKPFFEARRAALRLRRELLELASNFQHNKLELFFIKSYSSIPLDSDNFDILIKEKDLAKARKILYNLGLIEIAWEKEPYKYLFRRVKDGENYFAVHLHTRIAWEGFEFVDINDVWEERREVKLGDISIFVPSASHHLLVTLAHAFFENRDFKFGDFTYILDSVKEVDWQYVMNRVISDGWSKPFQALLFLSNHISNVMFESNLLPDEILFNAGIRQNSLAKKYIKEYNYERLRLKISTPLVLTYYVRKIFSSPEMSLLEKIEAALSLLNRGVWRRAPIGAKQPAFLVCFSGVDAAGKTTHALSLRNQLQKKDTARTKYVWSRGFGQSFEPILYFFRQVLSSKPNNRYQYERRHATILHYKPLKKLWAHLILLDHVIQLICRVRIPLILGDIVICDRYIQDTYVDAKCELGIQIGRLVKKLTEKLLPKPDVVLFLNATAKEIANRRSNVNVEEIECKRMSYLKSHLKERVITINAGDSLPQNKKKIVDIVLKNYYSTPPRKNYYSSKISLD